MKILELVNAKNAFDLNCKFDGDMSLGLKVVKFIKTIETETDFYNKKYSEIIAKYAVKDEDDKVVHEGNEVRIAKEFIEQFSSEMATLNDVDVVAPEIQFTLDELNKCDLTGNGLYALYPFISDIC